MFHLLLLVIVSIPASLLVVLLGVAEFEHQLAHSGDSDHAQDRGQAKQNAVGGATLQEHRLAIGFLRKESNLTLFDDFASRITAHLELGLDVLELLVALGDLGGRCGRRPGELARVLQHQAGDVLRRIDWRKKIT